MRKDYTLVAAGTTLLMAALLHVAAIFGGPPWFAFLGAPEGLIQMAGTDSLRPAISCLVIGAVLVVCAVYAWSGAGLIRRLPGLPLVLGLTGIGLVLRGLVLPLVAAWQPHLLSGICSKCQSFNTFVFFTSAVCLLAGMAILKGAIRARA